MAIGENQIKGEAEKNMWLTGSDWERINVSLKEDSR